MNNHQSQGHNLPLALSSCSRDTTSLGEIKISDFISYRSGIQLQKEVRTSLLFVLNMYLYGYFNGAFGSKPDYSLKFALLFPLFSNLFIRLCLERDRTLRPYCIFYYIYPAENFILSMII